MSVAASAAPSSFAPLRRPRKETFLARYPRKWKLAATAALLAVLAAPSVYPKLFPPTVASKAGPAPRALQAFAPSANRGAPAPIAAPTPETPVVSPMEAVTANDMDDHDARMARAPDPTLTETTAEGVLPRVAEDGRKPWQVYARPFNALDKRPRVALVVADMGLSRVASDAAIQRLPAAVTFAFDVQSPVVGAWLSRARQDGHETLLSVPMEPFDYPRSDPGPNTLLTSLPNSDNLQRLLWALRQGSGYVGITTLTGSRFTTDPGKITPVLETLKERGLLVLDTKVAPHSTVRDLSKYLELPVAISSMTVDRSASPAAIDAALAQLEQTARLTGHAIGVASPLPVTLDRLERWTRGLASRGVVLAPLSALVE